ncbi:MAG: TetR/AcrR family transcriptional regulator [Chloroflexota bacterium]
MSEATPSGAGTSSSRARLSRPAVLDAAVALADAEGIDGLSMRRLAKALGAEAMSLYHYVPSKDELLAGMLDRVLDEMAPATPSADWRASVKAAMVSRREVLQRHPWAADLQLRTASLTPSRLRQMEGLLAALHAGGFEGDLADHAYHAIDISVLGWSLWEARYDAMTRVAPDDRGAGEGGAGRRLAADGRAPRLPPAAARRPRVSTFEPA